MIHLKRIAFVFAFQQAVCNNKMEFIDVVARWPGSCKDSFILRRSNIYQSFERSAFANAILLGDSGYPLKTWLMTPLLQETSRAERRYNIAHKKTRSVVERAFGVLKMRWRIIDHTGGELCYTPTKVAQITVCCCVLHNICMRKNIPLPLNCSDENVIAENDVVLVDSDPSGRSRRNSIISTFDDL